MASSASLTSSWRRSVANLHCDQAIDPVLSEALWCRRNFLCKTNAGARTLTGADGTTLSVSLHWLIRVWCQFRKSLSITFSSPYGPSHCKPWWKLTKPTWVSFQNFTLLVSKRNTVENSHLTHLFSRMCSESVYSTRHFTNMLMDHSLRLSKINKKRIMESWPPLNDEISIAQNNALEDADVFKLLFFKGRLGNPRAWAGDHRGSVQFSVDRRQRLAEMEQQRNKAGSGTTAIPGALLVY